MIALSIERKWPRLQLSQQKNVFLSWTCMATRHVAGPSAAKIILQTFVVGLFFKH